MTVDPALSTQTLVSQLVLAAEWEFDETRDPVTVAADYAGITATGSRAARAREALAEAVDATWGARVGIALHVMLTTAAPASDADDLLVAA